MAFRHPFTNVLTFLSQPLALALIALFFSLLLEPREFSRYKLELLESGSYADPSRTSVFMDLHGDGIRERIHMRNLNTNGNLVAFSQSDRLLGTWDLPGFWYMAPAYGFGDTDADGNQEIFAISINSGDSVMVSQLELTDSDGIEKHRFVCKLSRINDAFDHLIQALGFFDITGDSVPDFVFFISAGFSLQPRAIYAWDLEQDALIRSPHAGLKMRIPFSHQGTEGGTLVYTTNTASQNYTSPVRYPDTASYAVVFRNGLDYLFEPVYSGGGQSLTSTLPLEVNGEDLVVAVTRHLRKDHGRITLRSFTPTGELLQIREGVDLPKNSYALNWKDRPCIYATDKNGFSLLEIDSELQLMELYKSPHPLTPISSIQLDSDSTAELLLFNSLEGTVAVLDDQLKSLAKLELNPSPGSISAVSLISQSPDRCRFFIQTRGTHYTLEYYKNRFYPFRYSYYLAVFGGFFILFFGLQKLFLFRNRQKKAREEEIIELQLKAVMNQLHPHFTFNAINSIGHLMLKGKKMEGYQYFVSLSDLIRKTMKNAFVPHKTLGEEVDFVKQYLKIESFRLQGKLKWNVKMDSGIDRNIPVPKMLIHLFVENAIKHGIFHQENGGSLNLSIKQMPTGVSIDITDDGIGRSQAKKMGNKAGDGLRILDSYLVLFNKQHKHKIRYQILDRVNSDPTLSGTQVIINIRFK